MSFLNTILYSHTIPTFGDVVEEEKILSGESDEGQNYLEKLARNEQ